MKYKEDDLVLQTMSCSGTVKGEVYKVEASSAGTLFITGKPGYHCNCSQYWKPAFTGAYTVGDVVKIVADFDNTDPEEIGKFYIIKKIDLDRKHPYVLNGSLAAMEGELELVTSMGTISNAPPQLPSEDNVAFIPAIDKYGWYQVKGEMPVLKEPLNKLLNKKGGLMASLSRLAKKTFDPDTRALIEVGVLNQDLTISDYTLIMEVVLEANKKAIATLAREVLKERAEAKKNCC